jgi:hypothetical protein
MSNRHIIFQTVWRSQDVLINGQMFSGPRLYTGLCKSIGQIFGGLLLLALYKEQSIYQVVP